MEVSLESRILDLKREGKNYPEIEAILGCARSTISYHLHKNNEAPTLKSRDWQEVNKALASGLTRKECLEIFSISKTSWLKAKNDGKITIYYPGRKKSLEEILIENSPYKSNGLSSLKSRLVKAGLLEYKCQICKVDKWRGQNLYLELDHINGNKKDNRIENLRILCPSCHTQTENFTGKNVLGVKKRKHGAHQGKVEAHKELLKVIGEMYGKFTIKEIMNVTGVSKATVLNLSGKLNLRIDKGVEYNWEKIQQFYNEGHSSKETIRKFKINDSIWDRGLRFNYLKTRTIQERSMSNEEFFVNGKLRSSSSIRFRLVSLGYTKLECLWCGISKWQGKHLTLQVDHINGIKTDNRIENLRLLCPNCHAQTPTYGIKNAKKKLNKVAA